MIFQINKRFLEAKIRSYAVEESPNAIRSEGSCFSLPSGTTTTSLRILLLL